ncbi:MAG: hypothetical protein ACOC0B_02480 [bacterium]
MPGNTANMRSLMVHVAAESGPQLRFRLRAKPDGLELSTGARSTYIGNAALEHATVRHALLAPCLWVRLKLQVDVHGLGPVSTLRIFARPWDRRELQRYADEMNGRVYDRDHLGDCRT